MTARAATLSPLRVLRTFSGSATNLKNGMPCRREEAVDVGTLIAAHGEFAQIRWLEKKLRCRRCRDPGM